MLLLVVVLFLGLLAGGPVHQLLHHDHHFESGKDCQACLLTGFEPPRPAPPLWLRIAAGRAESPRLDELDGRLGRAGVRTRAPPPAA